MKRFLPLVALAILAACSSGGTAKPLHAEASMAGYTVIYSKTDINSVDQGGPCAELVPNASLTSYLGGKVDQLECPGHGGLDTQMSALGCCRIAVWGLLPNGITKVTVAGTAAATSDSTYLAVLTKPSGDFKVKGFDHSGHQVAEVDSASLPPAVP